MEKISVKLTIAGREYPMKTEPSQEERILEAAQLINEQLAFYQKTFNLDDKQDLLALVAFDCMIEKLGREKELSEIESQVGLRLQVLQSALEKDLSS
jgi:cell division protein ZapA